MTCWYKKTYLEANLVKISPCLNLDNRRKKNTEIFEKTAIEK